MAGPCPYEHILTYRGKKLKFKDSTEFKAWLHDGGLEQLRDVIDIKDEPAGPTYIPPEGGGEPDGIDNPSRKKSVPNKVIEHAQNITADVRKEIEKNKLNYVQNDNKTAAKNAQSFIDSVGVDNAAFVAIDPTSNIDGDMRLMVFAKIIDHYNKMEDAATTPEEKSLAADKQGFFLDIMDQKARDSGRLIQAIKHFYKISELGLERAIKRREDRASEDVLNKKPGDNIPSKGQKISQGKKNLVEKAGKEAAAETVEKQQAAIEKAKKKLVEKYEKAVAKALKNNDEKAYKEALNKLNNVDKQLGLWGRYKKEAVSRLKNLTTSQIEGDVKSSPILKEFTDGLVKNISEKIKSSMPEKGGEKPTPKPAIEIIADAFKNIEKYKEVWDQVKSQMQEKYADNPEVLSQLDEYFGQILDKPFSDKLISSAVKGEAKDLGIDFGKIAKEHFLEAEANKEKLVTSLIEKSGLDEADARELAEALTTEYDKIVTKRRLSVLDQMFPKTNLQKIPGIGKKRDATHMKIVRALNAGVLDNEAYKRLFYDKFGLIDTNNPEVAAKLKEFSKQLYKHKDDENPIFYEAIMQDMFDYMASKRKESRILRGVESTMYANMLYGQETHFRNSGYNALASGLALGEALLFTPKGHRADVFKEYINGFKRGKVEFGSIMSKGYRKSGKYAEAEREMAERYKNAWAKYARVPGRLLSAFDALANFPLVEAKTRSMIAADLVKENKLLPKDQQLTTDQIQAMVNEQMGNTTDRYDAARIKAEKQVRDYYKLQEPLFINGERNEVYKDKQYNDAYRDFKRSVFNIMEAERNKVVTNEARQWADNALVMGQPKGYFGLVGKFLNSFGRTFPGAKVLTTPFVNVPLNVAANLVEFSPYGLITLMAKKEAAFVPSKYAKELGITQELSPERMRTLRFKAITGTAGMIAAYGLTEAMYNDDKEGRRPIMIVYADGTGNYQDNKSLKRVAGRNEFDEYTVDFMGVRFSYKTSPFAAWFLPIGAISDAQKFKKKAFPESGDSAWEKSKDLVDKLYYANAAYMSFLSDQAALDGITELFNINDKVAKFDDNTPFTTKAQEIIKNSGAKILRTMLVPGFIPQSYREYKSIGFDGLNFETNSKGFLQKMGKDIPIIDENIDRKEDHFGDPIPRKRDIPYVTEGEMPTSELYTMIAHKNYQPRDYTDRTIFVGNKEVFMTKSEVDDLNRKRNRIAGAEIKSRKEELDKLPPDKFKTEMNDIYKRAIEKVKDDAYGEGKWKDREEKGLDKNIYGIETDKMDSLVRKPRSTIRLIRR